MAFKSIKQNLKEVVALLKAYMQSNVDYYKLKALKKVAKTGGKVYRIIVLLLLLPLVLFFISIAAAIWIGNCFNDYVIGFAIVAAFYFVILILGLLIGSIFFRRTVLKKLSRKMFKEKE